ncbi:MAG TPA: hypothetical protein VFM38_00765 [Candidatus Limnocylindrales bacterium]|nr:hypothetical protein [Candidatus Limnocylindrales bacterium]
MTELELVVLRLMADGRTERQVGFELHYSHAWAHKTIAALRRKLGARNAPHAVALAFERGLID